MHVHQNGPSEFFGRFQFHRRRHSLAVCIFIGQSAVFSLQLKQLAKDSMDEGPIVKAESGVNEQKLERIAS